MPHDSHSPTPRAACLTGLLAIVLALLSGCKSSKPARPDRPERVITLTPSLTEVVHALGAADRIVAVDEYSEYPERVKALPRVGQFTTVSFEAILAQRPDLVILDRVQAEVAAGLESAGIATLVIEMHTIADVKTSLEKVAEALGTPEAARAPVAAIETAVDEAARRAEARTDPRPEVLVVLDRQNGSLGSMVVACSGTYVDELLAILGAKNAMAASGVRYARVSGEEILRAAPTVIIDAAHLPESHKAVRDWDELARVPAVATGAVHAVDDRLYMAPSPRVGAALTGLEQIVHGTAP